VLALRKGAAPALPGYAYGLTSLNNSSKTAISPTAVYSNNKSLRQTATTLWTYTIVGTVNSTEHKVTMKASPIWTCQINFASLQRQI